MVAVDPFNKIIRRPGRLRTLLLSMMIFCFLGLLGAEAYHHHKNLVEEEDCPLCQVAAHLPFDATPPPPAVIAVSVILLHHITHWWVSSWVGSSPRAAYHTRAPPTAFPG